MTEYPMWIGGSSVRTADSRAVRIPFDGSVAGTIFEAGREQVEAAIAAADPTMRALSRHERSTILYKAHTLLGARLELMTQAVSSESGKPIREARVEVDS